MNNQFSIFLVLFFLVLKSYSQHLNKISFETGAVINKPLINEERLKSDERTTASWDWTYKYHTSAGYFLKFSYEKHLISGRKWSLYLPVGISYVSQVIKYERDGYIWGCAGGESANELKTIEHKSANLSFGPTLQYEIIKFRVSGSLILNSCFTFDSKTRSSPYNVNDQYIDKYRQFRYNLYLSSQLGVLRKIGSNVWFGPACEIFYGNVSNSIHKARGTPIQFYNSDYGPKVNITGKNIWINPGIKLQIDLK